MERAASLKVRENQEVWDAGESAGKVAVVPHECIRVHGLSWHLAGEIPGLFLTPSGFV